MRLGIVIVGDAVPAIIEKEGLEGLIAARLIGWNEAGIVEVAMVGQFGHVLFGGFESIAEIYDLKVGLGSFWSSFGIEFEGWAYDGRVKG